MQVVVSVVKHDVEPPVQAKRRPIVRKHAKEDVSEEDGEKEEKEDEQDGKDENNEKSDSHEKNEKAQPQAGAQANMFFGQLLQSARRFDRSARAFL